MDGFPYVYSLIHKTLFFFWGSLQISPKISEEFKEKKSCKPETLFICSKSQKTKTKKNSGTFQLIINPECTVVLPMTIGTMFTYSGYLITHRQQIRYKDSNEKPFVNIVSYSSKRLFENMMESFRRYLDKA